MKSIGQWLIRIGTVLAGVEPPAEPAPVSAVWEHVPTALWPTEEMLHRAKALSAAQETPGLSGEYKRHQVFAQMLKEYPSVKRRTISLAIELGLG